MRISEILNELNFHGSTCTKDCSGHRAGFEWNKARGGASPCDSKSPSFNKGCNIATKQLSKNPKVRKSATTPVQNTQPKGSVGPA